MVAPNEKFNFTKSILSSLPIPPKGKRFSFKDEKERGLIIRVTASGQKTFQLYQKFDGRPVRVNLGSFPDTTIENARKTCLKAKNDLATGVNPNIEKNKLRQEITLKELFKKYMNDYSKIQKKSWEYDEREIPKFLEHWFNRRISSISKHEIHQLHLRIREKNGLYQANRMLERIRAMYNKAIEWGWDGANPSSGIKKFKEKTRDRFIRPIEMPLLFKALDLEENETARDYIYISLFTGARKTNVLQMRWEEIDWQSNYWRIPDTKNGEPVIIPLSDRAKELLDTRLKKSHGNAWVFPSNSKEGYLNDPKRSWLRIKQRATIFLWEKEEHILSIINEVKKEIGDHNLNQFFNRVIKTAEDRDIHLPTGLIDIRLHDIRRTFGSYQAMTGSSLQIIGKSMGHKSVQATQIYSRLSNDPVKASIDKATESMFSLGNEE